MTAELTDTLVRYLQAGRDALLWKLDGLSEYDARRPLTPTGTNVLGLVKHLAGVELGYFGDCFGRPHGEELPLDDPDADPHEDMWASPDESRADVVALYRRAWAHTAGTVEALDLEATATVPWWAPERRTPTLHTLLVHVVAETHRHAGHVDILREGIDGAAGLRPGGDNLPPDYDWEGHRARLEAAARRFAD